MLLLLAAWLLTNVVPFFGDAVDMLGASSTPLSCRIIPIAMFLRYYAGAEEKPQVSVAEWICLIVEVELALVLMFLGTYTSVQTIREHSPFQCHCKGLWATYECSGEPHQHGSLPPDSAIRRVHQARLGALRGHTPQEGGRLQWGPDEAVLSIASLLTSA